MRCSIACLRRLHGDRPRWPQSHSGARLSFSPLRSAQRVLLAMENDSEHCLTEGEEIASAVCDRRAPTAMLIAIFARRKRRVAQPEPAPDSYRLGARRCRPEGDLTSDAVKLWMRLD